MGVLARCALKIVSDVLLTWNRRDFFRFGNDAVVLVKTPVEFLTPQFDDV